MDEDGFLLNRTDEADYFADNVVRFVASKYNINWEFKNPVSEAYRCQFDGYYYRSLADLVMTSGDRRFFRSLNDRPTRLGRFSEARFDFVARSLWEDYLQNEYDPVNLVILCTKIALTGVNFYNANELEALNWAYDYIRIYVGLDVRIGFLFKPEIVL